VKIFALSLFALALAGCVRPRADGASTSAPPDAAPIVASATTVAAADAGFAPELVEFESGARTLRGFVWRPAGAGPFPAILFNHGSEEYPGAKDGQAQFFVPRGFVLFVPHRRGQGRSKAAGRYIDEFYDPSKPDSPAFVDELVAQNDDVLAALAYLAARPYVDAKRIAVAGCSLGGIESLFTAERATGIVAAIDFAGASMTWAKNRPLQERMKSAARSARVPVFFLQAENDFDVTPSLALSAEMRAAGKPARVRIFPPNGATHADGHAFCTGGKNPPWGEDVLAFLREAMP
jgi:dienelactone hydrolase